MECRNYCGCSTCSINYKPNHKRLEEAERDPGGGEFDKLTDSQRLEDTGWYYSDEDELEGDYIVDKYGKDYFIPKGFHPEFHK